MDLKKNKIKILLVDSDEMMRIYFRDIFWVHGRDNTYNIELASSIEEAEGKIKDENTKPDVVFLDILLQVQGGDNSIGEQIQRAVSFVEKIKNNKDWSNIKVIIYSAHKEKHIKEKFGQLGIEEYLIKGELLPKEIIAFLDKIHESNNKN